MPRYYFNLRDDLSADDDEGAELSDLQAAHARAVQFALDMAAASVLERRKIDLHHSIEVVNDCGEHVMSVAFGDVVTVES